jgi:hypothetical protein
MAGLGKIFEEFGMATQLLGGLWGFLRAKPGDQAADRVIQESFETRQPRFLELMRRAVYERSLVADHRIEGALGRLYDAGVYLSLDEFKGRRHEACCERVFLQSFGLTRRPKALWHPGPPGSAGLKTALRFARLGHRIDRWFSQTPTSARVDRKHAMLAAGITAASRLAGNAIPRPEHVPLDRAALVAEWLAACRQTGSPAFLSTTASCAVRVCTWCSRRSGPATVPTA